jgi:hypothetical protein
VLTRLRLPQPATTKPVIELVAQGRIGRWMQAKGWGAFTLPLPFITCIFYWNTPQPSPGARVHEFVHAYQNDHTFFLKGWILYLVQLAFHGYHGNSFEREAYFVEAVGARDGYASWATPDTKDDADNDIPFQPLLTGRSN